MTASVPAGRTLLALLLAAPALVACGDTARTIGLTRDAPDEFQVTTRAPLSMPPSLSNLPPPRPGAPRPQEIPAARQAESVLVPGAGLGSAGGAPTAGEQAILAQLPGGAPSDIRRRVDEESLRLERTDRSLTDRILFWRPQTEPGVPVDPARESQRLRENAALGREATDGTTPVIQPPRPQGLFSGLRFW
ncbi:MAG: DUF3035 domain-containing protein [Acetobacteraceae bacterium]|nr:DUF3035 domain-containing protein [Acetobacteraceae bacterium]